MFNEFYDIAATMKAQGEPFAAVTVVRNEAPSSGKTGDKAIVNKDGILRGWIGGGCVYSIMMKEVNDALYDGKPRFVRISPSDTEGGIVSGIKTYPMTCHSGGAIDLYIEPILPKPHLIIIGKSIIGRALMRIAKAADYRLTIIANDATKEIFPEADNVQTDFDISNIPFDASTFIVVATQGDNDEKALTTALSVTCRYVGFISSRKKRDAVFENLKAQGISSAQLQAIHAPAGIDINGKTHEEVAISILAEIIQDYRTKAVDNAIFNTNTKENTEKPKDFSFDSRPDTIVNPVCGLPISKSMSKYVYESGEHLFYFCCDGCKMKFEADPQKYIDNPVPLGTGM
jgi:xanthine dehydrogenase accessory factor